MNIKSSEWKGGVTVNQNCMSLKVTVRYIPVADCLSLLIKQEDHSLLLFEGLV